MTELSLLTRKLVRFSSLDPHDLAALAALPIIHKTFPARTTVVHSGDRPDQSIIIQDGFMLRTKSARAGQQIVSFHMPGDVPDLQSLFLQVMDHDLVTLTTCTLGFVSHSNLRQLVRQRVNIAEALWRETLFDSALLRAWLTNIGQRKAKARFASILLEIRERMENLEGDGNEFSFPLTQSQIGEILGVTDIHVNRIVSELKPLVSIRGQRARIFDRQKLVDLAGFDPSYLQNTTR